MHSKITGRTARCGCRFRYVSNFTTALCGYSASARISYWSLSADCNAICQKVTCSLLERTSQIAY